MALTRLVLTEFRYVPSERTRGRATLGFIYDLQPQRDPVSSDFFRPVGEEVDFAAFVAPIFPSDEVTGILDVDTSLGRGHAEPPAPRNPSSVVDEAPR